jgi:hypothetical protein
MGVSVRPGRRGLMPAGPALKLARTGAPAATSLVWGHRCPGTLPVVLEQSTCPRQFSHPASQHEILLGRIPLTSRTGQLLLNKVRCWIEPAQSFEKNQLGLNQMFFNSLRFTWAMCLLADAAVLLRAHALLEKIPRPVLLRDLLPSQLPLGLR